MMNNDNNSIIRVQSETICFFGISIFFIQKVNKIVYTYSNISKKWYSGMRENQINLSDQI